MSRFIEALDFVLRGRREAFVTGERYKVNYGNTTLGSKEEILTCTADVRQGQWEGTLGVQVRLHDQVTADLVGMGKLDDKRQHIVLVKPKAQDDSTVFQIGFRDGPRPVNLSSLYPSSYSPVKIQSKD